MRTVLVVISYYNAVPSDRLDNLLWQLARVPAGCPFDTVVVVNRAVQEDLRVSEKYPQVQFLYRPNIGYNIGAWSYGWQQNPGYDTYVFLQDECLIMKRGWLRSLVRRAFAGPGRLIGESIVDPAETWEQSQASYETYYERSGFDPARWADVAGDLNTPDSCRRFLESRSIPCEATMRHLRSLVLCAPRQVMDATGGFPIGESYREAVGSEIGCSKQVNAAGYRVEQAALLPYTFVAHPQWMWERCQARSARGLLKQIVQRFVPVAVRIRVRACRQAIQRPT